MSCGHMLDIKAENGPPGTGACWDWCETGEEGDGVPNSLPTKTLVGGPQSVPLFSSSDSSSEESPATIGAEKTEDVKWFINENQML